MEAAAENLKWECKATAKLCKPTADEVWPLLVDFCNLHKWLPTIDTRFKVEGVDGECGFIRHCASALPSPLQSGEPTVKWCREKLTGIDHTGKWLRYEIMENNMGFKSYEATWRVMPIDGGGGCGCQLEWSFVADPVDGVSYDDIAAHADFDLRGMAENIEKAFQST